MSDDADDATNHGIRNIHAARYQIVHDAMIHLHECDSDKRRKLYIMKNQNNDC